MEIGLAAGLIRLCFQRLVELFHNTCPQSCTDTAIRIDKFQNARAAFEQKGRHKNKTFGVIQLFYTQLAFCTNVAFISSRLAAVLRNSLWEGFQFSCILHGVNILRVKGSISLCQKLFFA